MEFLRKNGALVTLSLLVILISYTLGFQSGEKSVSSLATGIENYDGRENTEIDFSPFWKAWNIIENKYVPASTTMDRVGDQEKLWGSIEGLAKSLGDPYTVFFPPVESEMFASDIRGNFEGVGMEVLAQDGSIRVIAPLKDSPASR